MTTPKDFRWGSDGSPPEIGAHSEAKLRVFRDYLRLYLDIVTQPRVRQLRLTIVDGFAGGGYFSRGDTIVSGSPLVILDEIDAAKSRVNLDRSVPVEFLDRAHFVDSRRQNLDALRAKLWEDGYGTRIDKSIFLHEGPIEAHIKTLKAEVKKQSPRSGRSIFLLDQTGYTEVEFSMARSILTDLDRSEIIMTWAVDWLVDFISDKPDFVKAASSANIDEEMLRELLSFKEQKHARYLIQNRLAAHLREQLGFPYFTVFFVKPSDSHRALWLVHASQHPTARDAMVRTHWAVANASISHGPDGFGILGFTPDNEHTLPLPLEFDGPAEDRVMAGLKRDLVSTVVDNFGHEPVTVEKLQGLALNAGVMGTYAHFGDAVSASAEDREIQLLTPTGQLARPGAKVQSHHRVFIPEPPPLLALMGLDLPKK